MLVNMGLFLGGFERGFGLFLCLFNIIGVMRDDKWGIFERFLSALEGQK